MGRSRSIETSARRVDMEWRSLEELDIKRQIPIGQGLLQKESSHTVDFLESFDSSKTTTTNQQREKRKAEMKAGPRRHEDVCMLGKQSTMLCYYGVPCSWWASDFWNEQTCEKKFILVAFRKACMAKGRRRQVIVFAFG